MRIKQEKLWSAYNMEKTENAVRSRLLEAGKEEFRDRGFLKASLRAICKKADVTTGALYFFFESKAALFERNGGKAQRAYRRFFQSGKTAAARRI